MAIFLSPRDLSQRSNFYQQLSQLLGAGVTILNALDMLSRKSTRAYREPVRRMLEEITQGSNVTEAMRSLGKWTPTFDLALIHAGESSGRLDVIFKMLSNYYAERAAMARQIIADLAYPMFLFHFAVLIFAFVAWFQNASPIRLLMMTVGILGPVYALIFFMIYASQGKRGEGWRSTMESILRPVPLLGAARHSLALSRLAAALEALINAGVRIIEAWTLAAAASGSPALGRAVASWKSQLAGGRTPAEMVNESRQFPEVFANLYQTGEVSGQLDESLNRLHAYYRDEATRKMRLVSQWVPKGIYLGVMLVIAYKVVAFWLSYFNEVNKAIGP